MRFGCMDVCLCFIGAQRVPDRCQQVDRDCAARFVGSKPTARYRVQDTVRGPCCVSAAVTWGYMGERASVVTSGEH